MVPISEDGSDALEAWVRTQKGGRTKKFMLDTHPGLEVVVRRFHSVHAAVRSDDEPSGGFDALEASFASMLKEACDGKLKSGM